MINGLVKELHVLNYGPRKGYIVEWSFKGATLVVEWLSCKQWSWNVLFFMTNLDAVLLWLCGGTFSVCSGLQKVTFFVVDMVSKAEGVEASLSTLNSIIPNLSDAA